MFKLESYITPWLLSYIDQYVKLRREDFQLSLWGGDVVFNNLELRLGNIQKLVPTLPIIFQSGLIHELRIHIPWIRINSEPIVVTLNQIELVIVLNKECLPAHDSSSSTSSDIPSDTVLLQQQQPTTAEQSNYVQTVLARILNNVQIVVNNLIVKFIEDDVVISLSSRTAQCFAANQHWLKSFIELTPLDLSLRRLITLPDVTLCLDRRDPNGKVHRYEVPLLSRCSLECRIQMFYANVYQQLSTKPIQTRLSFNCANIEVSIVDNQLSMIRRLLESIMALLNEQSETNGDSSMHELKSQPSKEPQTTNAVLPLPPAPTPPPIVAVKENPPAKDSGTQEGWISWAWSYVPSVSTLFTEEEEEAAAAASVEPKENPSTTGTNEKKESLPEEQIQLIENMNNHQSPTPLLLAGIDLDRISLQYKITKNQGEKSSLVPFIGFIVEKANIIIERYKPTSTTAGDGQAVVSRVRKVKVSTSKVSLIWDQSLSTSLSDVEFTLHYDRHVRMTRLSLLVNDFHLRLKEDLLISPFQASLKLDHHRTYSLLHLDLSALTIQFDFQILAYLISVINQIRTIIDIIVAIFQPNRLIETVDDDQIYVDDLRNGTMKCLFQSNADLPNVNEILFKTMQNTCLTSSMTWKYPERRSILKCHILPLPFHDDLAGIVASNRVKTIECLMQYWHFGTKQFVTWQTLELTDGQPIFLDFSNDLGQNPYSEMWRIVLVNGASVINQANALAASTRIDSLQSQRYEPSIELAITIPNIRVHLMIDPKLISSRISSNFQSILDGCKHDVLTLNLENISFDYSQRFETKFISIETSLSLEALEYRFLTKRTCIEPALINLDLCIDTSKSSLLNNSVEIFSHHNEKYNAAFRIGKSSILVQLFLNVDHMNIRLSQSLTHLIHILHQHWIHSDMIQVLELPPVSPEDRLSYYTYYLFTNHLSCPIGLKQYNTTDNFHILAANQTMDFVWSKLNTEQIYVQFSLENFANDPFYSSGIDIHGTQTLVQFDNSPHLFYLHIEHDAHQIRRHVHFIGKFLIKNLSNLDLQLKLFLTVGSRSIDFSISKDQSYVSCLQTIEDIQSIQWNHSPLHPIDHLTADGLISSSDGTSLWIHLLHVGPFTCLVFTPIVIYRSFLTQDVQINFNPNQSCFLNAKGFYTYFHRIHFNDQHRKYPHRLQQIDADQMTESIFELTEQSYLTVDPNPSLEQLHQLDHIDQILRMDLLHSSSVDLIDLLREEDRKHPRTDEDFPSSLIESSNEILNPAFIPTMSANGPVSYEPHLPVSSKNSHPLITSAPLTTNSIDCRLEPIRLSSYLNTILIQLKPLTIVNNQTPFTFHLYANAGHDHLYISAEQTTCLSKLSHSQMQFILIDPHDGEHIQCQTISLILRQIPLMPSATLIQHRLSHNGSIDLYFIKSSNNEHFLIRLRHEYIDRTHLFTLQSKYVLSNQSHQGFFCTILPIGKQQYSIDQTYHTIESLPEKKIHLYRFQGVPSTDIEYFFIFQRIVQDRYNSNFFSKPIQLLAQTDESGNRQCFCVFHKDSIKSKSTGLEHSYQSLRGELYSLHQAYRQSTGQQEILLQFNPSWAFLQLVNSCPCSLLCRVENIASFPHIIPPYSSVLLGIDSPELSPNANQFYVDNLLNGSRLYLAQFQMQENKDSHLIQSMSKYFQQITTKTIPWSRPVKIDVRFEDVFLPIPGLHDVLIRAQPISLAASRTLIIEPVYRQRPNKTMVTSKSSNAISTHSSASASPITSVISEKTPRQYRGSFFEKSSSSTSMTTATQHFLKSWQDRAQWTHHRQIQMNFLVNKFSISLMDELTDITFFREILRLTIDKSQVLFHQHLIDYEPLLIQKQFFCSIEQFQIDNQCFSPKNQYDFPVVLMSKDEKRVSKAKVNRPAKKELKEATVMVPPPSGHHRQNSSSSVDTTMTDDTFPAFESLSHNHRSSRSTMTFNSDQAKFIKVHFHRLNERFIKIDFQLQPFDVYLEDQYIYVLLKIFSELLPLDLSVSTSSSSSKKQLRTDALENPLMKTPFVCESLFIGPIDIIVSVHASMKVYIGCHQLPMFVDKFQKNCIYSTNKQLLALITRHYLLSLITRSPMLLGSFDLLGNPSALIRNITDGVYDLFHLPYVGMRHGPSGFMVGISEGATSLLKHLSLGTLTSLTTFANSVARNMDRLAMDEEHSTRNEETSRQIPVGMTNGLLQGLELFSLSLLGAIAGLAEQPLASLRNRPESQAATTTVLSGVGKGLVGIVAKPVSGVAQLISQTGQGILYGTGLMNIPHRRHRQLEQDARINTTTSRLKLARSCQILSNHDEIIDCLDYVLEQNCIEHGILILTRQGRVIVYQKEDENEHGNHLLTHIDLKESPDSTALLLFNHLPFYVDSRLRYQFLALSRFLRQ